MFRIATSQNFDLKDGEMTGCNGCFATRCFIILLKILAKSGLAKGGCHGEKRSTHGNEQKCIKYVVENPEEKRSLGRPRSKWYYDIKTNLRYVGWQGAGWIYLALWIGKCSRGF